MLIFPRHQESFLHFITQKSKLLTKKTKSDVYRGTEIIGTSLDS